MRKFAKKWMVLVAVLSIMAMMFAGCGDKAEDTTTDTTEATDTAADDTTGTTPADDAGTSTTDTTTPSTAVE